MKIIAFIYDIHKNLLYIDYMDSNINSLAKITHNKQWKLNVHTILVGSAANENDAQIYKEYYIRKLNPLYNIPNYNIDLPLRINELEVININSSTKFNIDWSTAVSSLVGGGILGTVLAPGIGTIIGGALGLVLGSNIGNEAIRLVKVIAQSRIQ